MNDICCLSNSSKIRTFEEKYAVNSNHPNTEMEESTGACLFGSLHLNKGLVSFGHHDQTNCEAEERDGLSQVALTGIEWQIGEIENRRLVDVGHGLWTANHTTAAHLQRRQERRVRLELLMVLLLMLIVLWLHAHSARAHHRAQRSAVVRVHLDFKPKLRQMKCEPVRLVEKCGKMAKNGECSDAPWERIVKRNRRVY